MCVAVCVAECCIVLQCVAVCCSVLQCVAVCPLRTVLTCLWRILVNSSLVRVCVHTHTHTPISNVVRECRDMCSAHHTHIIAQTIHMGVVFRTHAEECAPIF